MNSDQIIEVLDGKSQGVSTEEICRALSATPQELGDVFESLRRDGKVIGFAGLWFGSAAFSEAVEKFLSALNSLHDKNPKAIYHSPVTALKVAGFKWTGKPLDRILSYLIDLNKISARGDKIRLTEFRKQLAPRQREFLDRVKQELEKNEVNTATPRDLAKSLFVPLPAVADILQVGEDVGEIVSLGEDVYYTADQMESLKKQLAQLFDNRPFTAGEARDALESSRRFIIPSLEYFDRIGFTVRDEDHRLIVQS